MIGVYKIVNQVNNKVYIGQSLDIEKRKEKHRNRTHNEHLKNAIEKYGKENFKFEVLFIADENEAKSKIRKLLNENETKFIKEYNALDNRFGYNINEGGRMGWKHTEASKQKMREARAKQVFTEASYKKGAEKRKGHLVSDETRKKIGLKSLGRKHSNETKEIIREKSIGNKNKIGKKISDEAKQKIKEARAKQVIKSKKVVCVNTGEVFNSVKEAGEKYVINPKNIRKCCVGINKTAKGLSWKYLEEGK